MSSKRPVVHTNLNCRVVALRETGEESDFQA